MRRRMIVLHVASNSRSVLQPPCDLVFQAENDCPRQEITKGMQEKRYLGLRIAMRRNRYESNQRGALDTNKLMRGHVLGRVRLRESCACSLNAIFAKNRFKCSNGRDFRLLRIADRHK